MATIYAVNGSPRRNGNTATVLESALKGAHSVGAETELIHLADLSFTGCRSCFGCKLLANRDPGHCCLPDELTPILEKLTEADGLILGTPIYFGGESGLFRNFIERLYFPLMRYDTAHTTLAKKSFPVAFVYTMNVSERQMERYGYPDRLKLLPSFAGRLFGHKKPVPSLFVCDTWQFSDYSKYDSSMFDAQHKAEMRKTQFPEDCQKAFEMGKRMVEEQNL